MLSHPFNYPSSKFKEIQDLSNLRILVADDEPLIRELLSSILAMSRCEIALAEDGLEAVEVWRQVRPHVILMDWRMPKLDGLEATARIRALESSTDAPRTMILSISSNLVKGQEAFAEARGFDGILGKPIHLPELFATLSGLATDLKQPGRFNHS